MLFVLSKTEGVAECTVEDVFVINSGGLRLLLDGQCLAVLDTSVVCLLVDQVKELA
jgi:hypothetical protein